MDEQTLRLEYLKLLLDRCLERQAALNNAVRHFYVSALVLFILLGFRPAELSLFGATFALPQAWLAALGPPFLAFLFLRMVSLYEAAASCRGSVIGKTRRVFSDLQLGLSSHEFSGLSEGLVWFQPIGEIRPSSGIMSEGCVLAFLWLGALAAVYFVPLVVVVYAGWFLWQHSTQLVSVLVSIVSVSLCVLALIVALRGGLGRLARKVME